MRHKFLRLLLFLGALGGSLQAVAEPYVMTPQDAITMLRGQASDVQAPSEVVGHLGYNGDYMYPFLLRSRLTLQVGQHAKDALHVVPLTSEGIGAELLSVMRGETLKGHGKIAVIVDKRRLGDVEGYTDKADFVILAEDSVDMSETFASIMTAAAQKNSSHQDAVSLYVDEGGRMAVDAIAKLASKATYQLTTEDKMIRVQGGINYNPRNIADGGGFSAATTMAQLQEKIAAMTDRLSFEYIAHQEFPIGAQFFDPLAEDKGFFDVSVNDQVIKQRLREYKRGTLHTHFAGYIDLGEGESIVVVHNGATIRVFLFYAKGRLVQQGQKFKANYMLQLEIAGQKIGKAHLAQGDVVDVPLGREAIMYEIPVEAIEGLADSHAGVHVYAQYVTTGFMAREANGATIVHAVSAPVLIAAQDGETRLLEAQLAEAKEELARLEAGEGGRGSYAARNGLDTDAKRIDYLRTTISILSEAVSIRHSELYDHTSKKLGAVACATAF